MRTINSSIAIDYYPYKYSFIFFFEEKYFNEAYMTNLVMWIKNHWWWSVVYAAIYMVLVYYGQKWMANRERFHLYRSLVAWNVVLAVFSILGAVRFLPNFITVLADKGVEHTVCVQDYSMGVTGCWTWLFALSKVIELVDTLFIILRKQKLIFLHWYHHATVLVYTWYSVQDETATGRWFVAMNFSVHALMYSYYAFRAMRFSIPKWVNIVITSLQIAQMIVGIWVNILAYARKLRGEQCDVPYSNIYWSFFMYFTYFLLFFHFFRNAYLKKQHDAAVAAHKKHDQDTNNVKSNHRKAE